MSPSNDSPEPDYITPKEMGKWLEREIADIQKATTLRIRDAYRLTTAYALGEVDADKAFQMDLAYQRRWGGDALPCVVKSEGMTDDEILQSIDGIRLRTRSVRSPGR